MSRIDDAKDIVSNPLFAKLMQELEAAAVNRIVSAQYHDHEARQAYAADIRAIRAFRSTVEAIAQEGQSTERKPAPA